MCLQNFELFLQNIGGGYIFAIMILATVMVIVLMVCFVFQSKNHKYQSIDKLIERGDKAVNHEHMENVSQISETEHTGYSFFQGNTMQKLYSKNL